MNTDTSVFFYEQEFYCLSNFSSFRVIFEGNDFMTAEHAYHWQKFANVDSADFIRHSIIYARSAHEALQIAKTAKIIRTPNWDNIKIKIMYRILEAKVSQHPYVLQKLLETGERKLVEDSWRDDFWGWGEYQNGLNHLGNLWMKLRQKLREQEQR